MTVPIPTAANVRAIEAELRTNLGKQADQYAQWHVALEGACRDDAPTDATSAHLLDFARRLGGETGAIRDCMESDRLGEAVEHACAAARILSDTMEFALRSAASRPWCVQKGNGGFA